MRQQAFDHRRARQFVTRVAEADRAPVRQQVLGQGARGGSERGHVGEQVDAEHLVQHVDRLHEIAGDIERAAGRLIPDAGGAIVTVVEEPA